LKDPFSFKDVKEVDKSKIYAAYRAWPSLAQRGLEARFDLPKKEFSRVVVLGMGGSAAAGDILTGWLRAGGKGEMAVCKGHVPFHDLKGSLAIVSSVSGQTKETLAMMKTAIDRHASVVSISSGGRVREVSESSGVPHIEVPKSPAPRFALPFMLFSSFAVANLALGLGREVESADAVREMKKLSKELDAESGTSNNEAKKLATVLMTKTPVIYGSTATHGAAVRFKSVLNENAKRHAMVDMMPELFHNEIESWEDPDGGFVPLFLRHSTDERSDADRAEAMIKILARRGTESIEIRGRGATSLGELVSMVYELDMVSYYLAIGLGRDPFVMRLMDELKNW
jgi:glucose/mannose-6-phosphate isomerase